MAIMLAMGIASDLRESYDRAPEFIRILTRWTIGGFALMACGVAISKGLDIAQDPRAAHIVFEIAEVGPGTVVPLAGWMRASLKLSEPFPSSDQESMGD